MPACHSRRARAETGALKHIRRPHNLLDWENETGARSRHVMDNLNSDDGKSWSLGDTVETVLDVVWAIVEFFAFFSRS